MRRERNDPFFTMRMAKLSRLAEGRVPKGRRGAHAHGNNTGRIHGQHKRVGKRGEVTLVMGTPSAPAGHLPYKAEEFILVHPQREIPADTLRRISKSSAAKKAMEVV